MRDREAENDQGLPALLVHTPDGRLLRFVRDFHIGRDHDCEVRIQDVHASRRHAKVSFANGAWSVHDLQSINGIYCDGHQIETATIDDRLTISLGADGPALLIELEHPAESATSDDETGETGETKVLADYYDRYVRKISDDDTDAAGGRTIMIRRLYQRQKRKYRGIVAVVTLAGFCAAGYAYYGHRRIAQQEAVAQELFYAMKSIDVHIAEVEQRIATVSPALNQSQDQVHAYMEQRRQLENRYDEFVSGLSDRQLSEEDRLILRVTRMFGECELAAPPDYISEVKSFIRRWKSTGRYVRATRQAQSYGYVRPIAEAFLAQNLPPQYLYLAMQESDFEPFASGKPTRWGIAKGMWQFIPETGARYGLKIGPLAGRPGPDPADDRLQWEKATPAAARYIKDIYATDAQASGLLVMASYNWGEQRVIDLLRTMPADPRERNFWNVLAKHRKRVPPETYNYVFNIVAAAVIGENPRLFGFEFDSPLGFLERS